MLPVAEVFGGFVCDEKFLGSGVDSAFLGVLNRKISCSEESGVAKGDDFSWSCLE